MLFKREMIDAILEGRKTATRRPVKYQSVPVPYLPGAAHGVVLHHEAMVHVPCRYRVGRIYAVQPGRGKKAVARILVTDVCRSRWRRINEVAARAEGFASREAFFDYVRGLHGADLDLDGEVWVIKFELVKGRG